MKAEKGYSYGPTGRGTSPFQRRDCTEMAEQPIERQPRDVLPEVKDVIAVASGKGGVGKSTVAVNLALSFVRMGKTSGLLDIDVYGPSAPTMFGIFEQPRTTPDHKLLPLEKYGLSLMSMGFLSTDDTPIIWRGPMVHGLVNQFLHQVDWGALDALVIDMPPGTGDAQLTLTQVAPLSGAVIVTTPQEVALIDARKGLKMFQKVNVPVLGIVENMSHFACPHCGEGTYIFSKGGGRSTAEELGVPFLGEIPIDPEIVVGGDQGEPIVIRHPDSPAARAFHAVAERTLAELARIQAQTAQARAAVGKMKW
ncbi:MAG: Mrp/NBP35 family ATP-binding protein [Planctomycetes bacterium]|nr:Mrp/NBP35 family ATP-binding protein [Planctomycetota bacterium]